MSAIEIMHIDGEWRPAASGNTGEVLDPADATVLAVVSEGGAGVAGRTNDGTCLPGAGGH
ncbi:hypothetical protein [Streptomyces sp. DH37]|uniref:hypothetical protein n=1 Tax=Streptomyces sp. DH37 TaxID=3040122 RepID=UPI002441D2F0|nr:hypothetical protein [Streptomyces sp. DH37]MDG9704301.1 hypothetical protein [Streptomyces sp. DH37]